jgi:hypothetical protein
MSTYWFFVMPSASRGAARVLDLMGTLRQDSYLISPTPAEADGRAIASDWSMVGHDLWSGVHQFDAEYGHPTESEHVVSAR